jgi:hypothetical protein
MRAALYVRVWDPATGPTAKRGAAVEAAVRTTLSLVLVGVPDARVASEDGTRQAVHRSHVRAGVCTYRDPFRPPFQAGQPDQAILACRWAVGQQGC